MRPIEMHKERLRKLAQAEHMRRAAVYLSVRAFAEARAHWQTLIDNYPQDPRVPEALLGIGRSYFLGKIYEDGYKVFNQLVQDYGPTKEGREALNFSAASLLRMGRFSESAARYAEYVDRFPNGERIDTAHLNVIDTLREANQTCRSTQVGHAHATTVCRLRQWKRMRCLRRCVCTLRRENGPTLCSWPTSC